MSKRSRYLIIFLGFLLFLILAPILAFYSAGLSFDWEKGGLIKTGILAFKTDPKNLEVFLDGIKKTSTNETLSFLKPKDYTIKFSDPSYCTWQKKLAVNSGEVTWVSPYNSKVYLLKDLAENKVLSSDTIDFYYSSGDIYALKKDSIEIINTKNGQSSTTNFTGEINSILPINDNSLLLAGKSSSSQEQILIFNKTNKTITNISNIFEKTPKVLETNGNFYGLFEQNLYSFDEKLSTKKMILSNVLDFNILASDAYALLSSSSETSLITFPIQNSLATNKLAVLPKFKTAQMLITNQKQIFVLGDSQLYQVGLETKSLGIISDMSFDKNSPSLIYFGQGETDFFDFGQNQPKLISRSGQSVKNLKLAGNIGYAIWLSGNEIKAIELDTRDQQNTCGLYQGNNIIKFQLDENNHFMYILDGDELKMVEIR